MALSAIKYLAECIVPFQTWLCILLLGFAEFGVLAASLHSTGPKRNPLRSQCLPFRQGRPEVAECMPARPKPDVEELFGLVGVGPVYFIIRSVLAVQPSALT